MASPWSRDLGANFRAAARHEAQKALHSAPGAASGRLARKDVAAPGLRLQTWDPQNATERHHAACHGLSQAVGLRARFRLRRSELLWAGRAGSTRRSGLSIPKSKKCCSKSTTGSPPRSTGSRPGSEVSGWPWAPVKGGAPTGGSPACIHQSRPTLGSPRASLGLAGGRGPHLFVPALHLHRRHRRHGSWAELGDARRSETKSERIARRPLGEGGSGLGSARKRSKESLGSGSAPALLWLCSLTCLGPCPGPAFHVVCWDLSARSSAPFDAFPDEASRTWRHQVLQGGKGWGLG